MKNNTTTAATFADAKKFNLFEKHELPSILFKTQTIGNIFSANYAEKIEAAKLELPDAILSKFSPVLLFEVREQKCNFTNKVELIYIEHTYTAYKTPAGNIALLRYDRNKKYYFSPHYCYYIGVQNVSHHKREQARKDSGLTEPNYIGKFTEKKILDWLNYCDAEIELNKKIVDDSQAKNAEIEKQIADFASKSGGTVYTWQDKTEIKTSLFNVIFTHSKREQCVSHKIEFTGTLNDVLS